MRCKSWREDVRPVWKLYDVCAFVQRRQQTFRPKLAANKLFSPRIFRIIPLLYSCYYTSSNIHSIESEFLSSCDPQYSCTNPRQSQGVTKNYRMRDVENVKKDNCNGEKRGRNYGKKALIHPHTSATFYRGMMMTEYLRLNKQRWRNNLKFESIHRANKWKIIFCWHSRTGIKKYW